MRYTYDCLLEWDDGWWLARFPQLGDFTTQGKTREEALSEASDLLVMLLADYAERGENPPACRRLVECVAVSVEVTQEDFDETRYETQAQAAERLGVSKSRISAQGVHRIGQPICRRLPEGREAQGERLTAEGEAKTSYPTSPIR